MYTFRRGKLKESVQMGGWNVAELLGLADSQEYQAAYLGKVKTLFGEPDSTSYDMENLFSYDIVAESSAGNAIQLVIYFGPSGPSIASPDGDDAKAAVTELAKQIIDAKPTDYEIECEYEDIPVTVILGVKDGKPYCESLFPGMTRDMSEEEKMALAENFLEDFEM